MKYKNIKHIGNRYQRTKSFSPEKIFADEWEKINKRKHGYDRGRGALESLISPPFFDLPIELKQSDCTVEEIMIDKITQRDAFIAATIIQWLGTKVGKCFLENCERKIIKAKK